MKNSDPIIYLIFIYCIL